MNEMEYIRVLSFAKEAYFSTEIDIDLDLIQECQFTDYKVPCKKYKHFNYYHGDCETISAGNRMDLDTPITGIKIEGIAHKQYPAYQFQRQPSFVLVLHKPETPPIFFRENLIIRDYYGDYVIQLKKKIINRIDCFEEEDLVNKNIPGIKSENKYSYEACLASCYQNFTMSQCSCILPQFYFAENSYRFPVCRMCRGDFTYDISGICDCKPACKDVEWEWRVEDEKYINELEPKPINKRFMQIQTDDNENRGPDFNKENNYDFRPSLKKKKKEEQADEPLEDSRWRKVYRDPSSFRVTVQYETVDVTIVNEKLLMKRVHLIGTIGGSICLFFGTYMIEALYFLVLEMLHCFRESKRKLRLLKIDLYLNIRRAMVVMKELLWVVPTIALAILSGFLSIDLIGDYLNFPTLQHPSVIWNRDFPAVTVCSGVPVLWHKYNNQTQFIREIVKEMEDVHKNYKEKAIVSFENAIETTDYYEILHHKLQTGSRREREEIGLKKDDYIKKCTWRESGLSYNCSKTQFVEFNNHKYGNCVTFNHGSLTTKDNNGPIDELEMILSFNQHEVPIGRNGQPGIIVHLHERGTAPLFTPSSTHLIRAFTFNHITFTSEKHRFLSRDCLDGKDAEMREKSVYEDENRQYLHTTKSCLESCFQKLSHEEPRCRSCYQPQLLGKYDVNEENTCTTFCPWIDKELFHYKCGCKQSCNSTKYNTQISASTFNKSPKNSFKVKHDQGPIDYTISSHDDEFITFAHAHFKYCLILPDGNCGFKISAQTNKQNEIYETPKIKLANLLGLIGGIMGFLQALLSIFRSLRILITKSS